jgi:hypothetical protein
MANNHGVDNDPIVEHRWRRSPEKEKDRQSLSFSHGGACALYLWSLRSRLIAGGA